MQVGMHIVVALSLGDLVAVLTIVVIIFRVGLGTVSLSWLLLLEEAIDVMILIWFLRLCTHSSIDLLLHLWRLNQLVLIWTIIILVGKFYYVSYVY
jgi:hypothetical protein